MQRRDDHPTLGPLFDAVVEAPDDDAPRQVLSDALLDRGDVRGEFIALQLLRAHGVATPKQQSREQILQENHWRRWFSEVPGVGVSATTALTSLHEFHRGFLRACVLTPCGVGADSPAWRMVERIDVTGPSIQNPGELAAPALARLSVLTGLNAAGLQVVLDGPQRPRLHELGFAGPWLQADRGRQEQRQVLALKRFSTLRVLALAPNPFRHHADHLAWLFESPLVLQLERVSLWMELPFDVAGLHALLVQHRLERMKLELVNTGLKLTLFQDWLTVQFDDAFWLGQRAQAVRNLASHFAPFPYPRFDVRVGARPATKDELARLGSVVVAHAR
ncbi:MAG: TIGR02996 domain-containing protein [Archangium sp.]|nr:TIGR02996 domain-containing protein [Archangium sp.]MDP3155652.1 TIGR02996 domain-containing protein [Archangium sp.]MDP3570742.1 TIGR02996 domain-containing protein [Archangium sp.]